MDNLSKQQQDDAASRFAAIGKAVKKEAAEKGLRYRVRKLAYALAPVFEVSRTEIRRLWEICEDPVQELYDSCMPELRVYAGAPVKWLVLVKGICKTPVWAFFAQQVSAQTPYPVVVFRVKGHKEPWVMTSRQSAHEEMFEPRIMIPVRGCSRCVFVMPIETFIKEYSNG